MTTLDAFQFFEIDHGRRCSVNMDVFFPTFLLDNEYVYLSRFPSACFLDYNIRDRYSSFNKNKRLINVPYQRKLRLNSTEVKLIIEVWIDLNPYFNPVFESRTIVFEREKNERRGRRRRRSKKRWKESRFGFRTRWWTARVTQEGWTSWSTSRPTSRIHPRRFEVIKLSFFVPSSSFPPSFSPWKGEQDVFVQRGRAIRGATRIPKCWGHDRLATIGLIKN